MTPEEKQPVHTDSVNGANKQAEVVKNKAALFTRKMFDVSSWRKLTH